MPISVGDKIPAVTLFEVTEDGPAAISSDDVFAGKKIAMFGVPGAFTGTCQNVHMPTFVENADALRAKGADEIVCVSVNDPFVMQAWSGLTGADGAGIRCIGDSQGELAEAMDLVMDGSAVGLGKRIQRFSAIVDDGVITALNVEEKRGAVELSGGDVLLGQL